MRKFKHKITGNIATEIHSGYNYKVTNPQNFTIPKWIVENSSDWQEIIDIPVGTKIQLFIGEAIKTEDGKWYCPQIQLNINIDESKIGEGKRFQIVKEETKRDWEILKIKNSYDGNIITYNSKGEPIHRTDGCRIQNTLNLKQCLNTKNVDIFQVKRLLDGEIFTLGDKVDFIVSTNQVIKEFSLTGNHISVISEVSKDSLSAIKKSKPVLFITEDGKEIYSGDSYYSVCYKKYLNEEPFSKINGKFTAIYPSDNEVLNYLKFFSSYEAAENYIIMNKPCLSINDIYKTVSRGVLGYEQNLKELVKSKL